MALQSGMSFDQQAQTIITVKPGDTVRLPVDTSETSFSRDGVDLTLTTGSSVNIYKNFFAQGEGKPLPTLELADGTTISGEEFLKGMNPEMELETAAGATATSVASSGSGEYADNAGNLIDGVSALGALEGLGQWAYGSTPELMVTDALGTEGANTGPSSIPGTSDPGTTNPELPDSGAYFARVILTNTDQQRFSFCAHDENGHVAVGDAALSGAAAAYFAILGTQPDGKIFFGLTEAGLAALQRGEDISGTLIVTVNGTEYPVHVSGQGSGTGYESDGAPGLVSEWYESHGAVENADITLGAEKINSVLINSDSRVIISSITSQEWIFNYDDRYDPELDPSAHGSYMLDVIHDTTAVIGVRNSTIDAGNTGEINIRATTNESVSDFESQHTDLNAVYGVYGGAQNDVTSITGGSITIGAQVTDKDAPAADDTSYDSRYAAVGIMNKGGAVEYEYYENSPPVPVPGDPSLVTVTGQNITIQAEADIFNNWSETTVTGIHNGSSSNSVAPTSLSTRSALIIPSNSNAHTVLKGQDNVSNIITVSATATGHREGQEEVTYGHVFATGIKNEGGRVDIVGGNADDSITIQAKIDGDLGGYPGGGYYGSGYTVAGIDVSGPYNGETSSVCIDGGEGKDALQINAEVNVAKPTGDDAGVSGAVYGARVAHGELSLKNVEDITITANGLDGDWVYGILAERESSVSITTGDSDMTLRIASGGVGMATMYSNTTIQSGDDLDLTVTAGQVGISTEGWLWDSDSETFVAAKTAIAAEGDLTMRIDVDGSGGTEYFWDYEGALVAGVLTQNSARTEITSEGKMDLAVTATSESGTAHALYTDSSYTWDGDKASLLVESGAENDTLSFIGNITTIGGLTEIFTQDGDDSITITGDIVTSGAAWGEGDGDGKGFTLIDMGADNDVFHITGNLTALEGGSIKIDMGDGDDLVILDGSTITDNVFIDGGTGNDALQYIFHDSTDALNSFLDAFYGNRITNFEDVKIVITEAQRDDVGIFLNEYASTNTNLNVQFDELTAMLLISNGC